MGLAVAEGRYPIEYSRGFGLFTPQAAHDFGGEADEIPGEISAVEVGLRLLIIGRRAA